MGRILYFIPLLLIVGFLGAVALPKLIENAENPGDVNALPSTLAGKPAPALGIPFYLQPPRDGALWAVSRLWFPSYPTGSTWNTTVSCPNGVASRQTFW